MKKNRPAYKLTVICDEKDIEAMEDIIFMETTTEKRTCLERSFDTVDTKYGKLDVKKILKDGKEVVYPEYSSAKELAVKNNVALKEIYKMR